MRLNIHSLAGIITAALMMTASAPADARFLSKDPVPANPDNGQNFNSYWYANNNPYKFTDPDGRYVCTSGPQNCGRIDSAIAAIGTAAGNLPSNNHEQQTVQQSADFYGKPWEDNGVTVGDHHDPSAGGGTLTSGGKTAVTIDVAGFKTTADLAASLGHEGDHGSEQKKFGMPTTEARENAGEKRASTTEALIYKGLGVDSPRGTWTQSGGLDHKAIEKEAAESTAIWCTDNSACN